MISYIVLDLNTLCVVHPLWPLIFIYIFLKTPVAASQCLDQQEYLFIMSSGGVGASCLNFVCLTIQSVTVPRS